MPQQVTKDPESVLDYAWDWTDWLADGETITAQTVEVTGPDTTLVVETTPPVAQAAGVVTAWLSGGTLGETYDVVCHITTSAGRQEDRTLYVLILDR